MILQRLSEHYDRLASDPDNRLPRPGWSLQKVSFCVVLNKDGSLHSFESLLEPAGRKLVPHEVNVPGYGERSSGITPHFLWEKSQYMLGYHPTNPKPERTATCFEAFRHRHLVAETYIHHPEFKAVCTFLRSWSPEKAAKYSTELDNVATNFGVFRIAGERHWVHEVIPAALIEMEHKIHEAAQPNEKRNPPIEGMCLVTGAYGAIARLHLSIDRVTDAPGGAPLVSMNKPAYWSYCKEQSYNAPIRTDAAFKYANALNFLLNDERRRVSLGDATVVFWAERRHPLEEFISDLLADVPSAPTNDSAEEDEKRVHEVRRFVKQLRDGAATGRAIDPSSRTRFFILGLAPNASRISVRFWIEADAGEMERRLAQHLSDTDLIRRDDRPLTLRDIARATGRAEYHPDGRFKRFDSDSVPDQLVGELARSVLTGGAYPQSLLSAMLRRIRSDGEVHYARVAAIKGCLVRNSRVRGASLEVSVELDASYANPAYRMGRVFALLEKIQEDSADSDLNTTVKDRYFSSASATPAIVFPRLFRLSQHHQAKLATGAKIYYEKLLQEAMSGLSSFPAHLALEDQGLFVIGY